MSEARTSRAKRRSNLHDPVRLTPRGYIVVVNHRDGRQTLIESADIRLRGGEIQCDCCTSGAHEPTKGR